MPYDGKILARARTELENIKANNIAEQQRRQHKVYARLPELERIDAEMRAGMAELVRLTIARRPDIKERVAMLRDNNLNLQKRKAQLMENAGFPADYLDEIFTCPKCRDTGIYEGGVCSCLDRLYNAELTKELGTLMRRGDESFDKFNLNYYPAEYDAGIGSSPREFMSAVYERCRRYAENFSSASPNLLFSGGTGLGKTYLSACIARVIAGRGCSVCYESTAAALESFERAKFSRDSEESEAAALKVRRMQDCDLMILDDLGTEMATPIAQSALYTLINSRLVNGKKTIISTNLTDSELSSKYTPQISSRILGEFQKFPFYGQDIRRMKK